MLPLGAARNAKLKVRGHGLRLIRYDVAIKNDRGLRDEKVTSRRRPKPSVRRDRRTAVVNCVVGSQKTVRAGRAGK
jgi:hypothetical protein